MKEARIVNAIKFDNTYFQCGDIVKISTCHGKTHIGRIVHYSKSDDVQKYIKLDTSERFESNDSIISMSEIASIEYAEEHYRRHVEEIV